MTSVMQSSSSTSSSGSASSANLLRISGMASGIDTDSVVKAMVSNYQTKIDKENQAKQILQWKQDGYRDIIKGIKSLQDYFNPTSSKYILGGSAMNINTAASSDASKASATASSTAQVGTYVVTTNNLAQQAKVAGSSLDSMINVTDVKNASDWANVGLTIDGKTIDVTKASSASDAVSKINSQIASLAVNDTKLSGVSASYVNDGTNSYIKLTKSSTNTSVVDFAATFNTNNIVSSSTMDGTNYAINSGISSSTKLSDLNITNPINFTVNGKFVSLTPVSGTTTVQNLMDAVKSTTSGAVTMSIDDTTGSISFQSKNYGSTSSVTLVDDSNKTLKSLLKYSDTATTPYSKTGADGNVTITEPGKSAVTTTQSSNNFTLNGMTYNLVNTGTSNITVTSDSDKVITNIKNFITDYNTIISTINTKLTEKKNSDYPPLTDAQKESMSESQITAWETKAKVGVLRNDDYLNNLMTQLRGIFSSPVYSSYNSADITSGKVPLSLGQYGSSAIGIDTSSDVTDGGILVIKDQTKLKDTIENNFDDFKKLFTGVSTNSLPDGKTYIGSQTYMEDGLFTRMNNILVDYVATPGIGTDGTYTLSGSMNIFVNKQYDYSVSGTSSKNTLPDQVYEKTLSITKLKTQMTDAENSYYAKFTALETAMTKLNSQQSQLSAMLGTA